jgi:cytochrome c oxidase subunit 3
VADAHAIVAHQFDSVEQQRGAATLGMWVFLISEIMLFGGLFTGYAFLRTTYPAAFAAASGHNNLIIGTVNTVVLIVSSLTMALAVERARTGARSAVAALLGVTAGLGGVFLVLKGVEYAEHWHDRLVPGLAFAWPGPDARPVELFFWLYFVMTGLHALHLLVGIGLVGVLLALAARGRFSPTYHTPVEIGGLYWHLIDVVWVFLFPLLYLVGAHRGGA